MSHPGALVVTVGAPLPHESPQSSNLKKLEKQCQLRKAKLTELMESFAADVSTEPEFEPVTPTESSGPRSVGWQELLSTSSSQSGVAVFKQGHSLLKRRKLPSPRFVGLPDPR